MRRSLISAGLAGLPWTFVRTRAVGSLLTGLGVLVAVMLVSALVTLGVSLQAAIHRQLSTGLGVYSLTVQAPPNGSFSEEQLGRLARAEGVEYTVGMLRLEPFSPPELGVAVRYIGVGEFPGPDLTYSLVAGEHPKPGEFVTTASMAKELGLSVGQSIALPFASGRQTVRLAGIRPDAGEPALLLPLAWLQQQSGLQGQMSHLLVNVDHAVFRQSITFGILHVLPGSKISWRQDLAGQRVLPVILRSQGPTFAGAAAVTALFLVMSSFRIAVQQRRRELALLRAIGATPRQTVDLVLRESALVGALGGVTGAALGVLLVALLQPAILRWAEMEPHPLQVPWGLLTLAVLLGVLLALAAAWQPAREAGRVPAMEAMRSRQSGRAEGWTGGWIGQLLVVIAVGLIGYAATFDRGHPLQRWAAYGGLLFVCGVVVSAGNLLPGLVRLVASPFLRLFPVEGLLAERALLRHRRRTALTLTTLVIAMAVLAGVGTKFSGFDTVNDWLVHVDVPMDFTVDSGPQGSLGTDLVRQVRAVDGVRAVLTVDERVSGVWVNYDLQRYDPEYVKELRQRRPNDPTPGRLLWVTPIDTQMLSQVFPFGRVEGDLARPGLLVREDEARRRGLRLGDEVILLRQEDREKRMQGIDAPEYSFTVTAIVEILPLREPMVVSRELLPEQPANAIWVDFESGHEKGAAQAVEALLEPLPLSLEFRNQHVELAGHRRTAGLLWAAFAVTVAILFLSSGLAIVTTVLAGMHERMREVAVVRAVGSTPLQTSRQLLLEAGTLGVVGSLIGAVAATGLVVGQTIAYGQLPSYPLSFYLLAVLAGPVITLVSAVRPARQMARQAVPRMLTSDYGE